LVEAKDIELLVQGDVSVIDVAREAPHDAVVSAWQRSSRPALMASSVIRVLTDLITGRARPEAVQAWASFIMRGYLEPVGPPIMPVDVEYEAKHEDAIVEAIAVLEQMGDSIDGDPSEEDLRQLIGDLTA